MPKLTKAERQVEAQMLVLLEWASSRSGWHDIGQEPATVKAATLLEKRGVIEIRQPQNQYRLIPSAS